MVTFEGTHPFHPTPMPEMPLAAGAVLLIGCLGVLLANVMNAARR